MRKLLAALISLSLLLIAMPASAGKTVDARISSIGVTVGCSSLDVTVSVTGTYFDGKEGLVFIELSKVTPPPTVYGTYVRTSGGSAYATLAASPGAVYTVRGYLYTGKGKGGMVPNKMLDLLDAQGTYTVGCP